MKNRLVYIYIIILLSSCEYINFQEQKNSTLEPIATVFNAKLYFKDIAGFFHSNISKQDSLVLAKSLINSWATQQLILKKSEENSSLETSKEINKLVKDYKESLLINNYKEVLIKQQLDTIISNQEIKNYYNLNKENFKLNEELIKIKYLYFSKDIINKKEIVELFKSDDIEDLEELEKKYLNFKTYHLNDSIWSRIDNILLKLPFSKEKLLKKTKFIQKQDSIGLYLVAVKDVLLRNNIAPLSYIKPTIKQTILHKRKIELIREIEKIIVKDAIQNKSFKIY